MRNRGEQATISKGRTCLIGFLYFAFWEQQQRGKVQATGLCATCFFFSFFDQAVRYSIYLYPPSRFLVFHHNPLQFLWTFEVLTFLLICDLSFEFADSFHFSVF